MSKFDEKVSMYEENMKSLNIPVDSALLRSVTKACGPAIYLADASLVSGTDPQELARVKNNFLIKKLGLSDGAALDAGISAAVSTLGASNRNKHRAIFYYLLVKHFKKEGLFK